MDVSSDKCDPLSRVPDDKKHVLELDSEGKAKSIPIWRFTQPHMMAFHVSLSYKLKHMGPTYLRRNRNLS